MNNVFKKAVTLLAVFAASISTLEVSARGSRLAGRQFSRGGSAAGMNRQRGGGSNYEKTRASSNVFTPAKIRTLKKSQIESITAAHINGMHKETLEAFTGSQYGYLLNTARTAFRARANAVKASLSFDPAIVSTY